MENKKECIIERCIRCKVLVNQSVDINKQYYVCKKCHVFVANPLHNKLNKKEVENMTAKKEKVIKAKETKETKAATENSVPEKGKNITEIREENAKKLRDFMTNELGLDASDQRKLMSRAYNQIAHEQKK